MHSELLNPSIHIPRIVQIDEGPHPFELFITKSGQQIISSISGISENPQDKGKILEHIRTTQSRHLDSPSAGLRNRSIKRWKKAFLLKHLNTT